MIGTTVGKYRIVSRLGRGGMGTVYKAVDETLDREVAIKVLNSEVSDAKLMARFRSEAVTLARLNHPQIATIYEIYKTDQDLLMVMELVRGETLDQLLMRNGPLPPERAAYLVAQVLGALSHAHRSGIIHRDLKPANVMITETGGVKIMDFGIARVIGAEHLTSDGTMVGTPAYMAPEQVVGKEIDARADLYSVGVVLYRLISGCLPFDGDTPIAIVQKQMWDPPTPVRTHRPDLPEWSETILNRALAKSPSDRHQTAEEFRSALLSAIGYSTGQMLVDSGAFTFRELVPQSAATPAPGTPADRALTPAELIAIAPTVVGEPTPADALVSPAHSASRPSPPQAAVPLAPATPATPPVPPATAAPAAAGTPVTTTKPAADQGKQPAQPAAVRSRTPVVAGVAALLVVAAIATTVVVVRRSRDVSSPPGTPAAAAGTPVNDPSRTPAEVPVVSEPANQAAADATSPPAPPTEVPVATKGAGTTAAPKATQKTTTSVAPVAPPVVLEANSMPVVAAPPVAAPETAETAAALALPPVIFSAQAVVVEGGRNRQRDTTVQFANGTVTVTGKDNAVLTTLPFNAVVGATYSNSKQPLWNSPQGPAEITHLDGGAFGFLKGAQNWVSLRTDSMSLVLRVRDQDSRRVLMAIEERIGKKVERVSEPKDR